MRVNDPFVNFKKHKCISEMQSEHIEQWDVFARIVKAPLDSIPILRETAFTPHDFSHHCYNIYKILSNVLIDNYENTSLLSSEALLLLNLAVLFHDYSMTMPNFNRLTHSVDSADMFIKMCSSGNIPHDLSDKQIRIIQKIIIAHSDVKEKVLDDEKVTRYTFHEVANLKEDPGTIESKINTPFLAGLLRLADELDITSDRVGNKVNQIDKLNENDPSQLYSKRCWEKLLYFDSVSADDEDFIVLKVNDLRYSNDTTHGYEIVSKVTSKIHTELDNIRTKVFSGIARKTVRVQGVRFEQNGTAHNIGNFLPLSQQQNNTSVIDNVSSVVHMNLLRYATAGKSISSELDTIVYEKSLFKGGHFNINSQYCTRDWINTTDILYDKECRALIIDVLSNEVDPLLDDESLLAGIELNGSILASSVAYSLNRPFSYIIPDKSKDINSMQDRKFSAEGFETIVLFTDVIVSFNTILNAINDNGLRSKRVIICTIFLRPIENEDTDILEDLSLLKHFNDDTYPRIIVLNDSFPAILFPKETCSINSLSQRIPGATFTCLNCQRISE